MGHLTVPPTSAPGSFKQIGVWQSRYSPCKLRGSAGKSRRLSRRIFFFRLSLRVRHKLRLVHEQKVLISKKKIEIHDTFLVVDSRCQRTRMAVPGVIFVPASIRSAPRPSALSCSALSLLQLALGWGHENVSPPLLIFNWYLRRLWPWPNIRRNVDIASTCFPFFSRVKICGSIDMTV